MMQLDIDALNLMIGLFAGAGMTMVVIIIMYHISNHDDLPPPDGNVLLVTQTELNNLIRQAQNFEKRARNQLDSIQEMMRLARTEFYLNGKN